MWKYIVALALVGVVAGRVNRPYDVARMREIIENSCKKNGAEDKIDEVVEGMLEGTVCLKNAIDKEAMARIFETPTPDVSKEIITFVQTTCKSQKEILKCLNSVVDATIPCMESLEKEKLDVSKKSLVEVTDLFCKNDSASFAEFINDGAITCVENQLYPIMACTQRIQTISNYKTLSNTEACNEIESLNSCIVKVMETCPKPSTATFFKSMVSALMRGSLCAFYSEENKITANMV